MKKKMTKSVLFKNAWKIARKGVEQFGGSVKDYFAEALKQAWAMKKEFDAPKPALEIKVWFKNKKFFGHDAMVVDYSYERKIERETAKAALIKFVSDYGTITEWIPKSCLVA